MNFPGFPGIFFLIDNQDSGQEFNLVAKNIERYGSREEGQVLEKNFAKRRIGARGIVKSKRTRQVALRERLVGKQNAFRDFKCVLLNQQTRFAGIISRVENAPRSFGRPAVLNKGKGRNVEHER